MEHREYKSINKSVRKKDSMQLLLGKPVYTDDLVNNHPLVVKILRSPHPNAIVEEINTAIAKKSAWGCRYLYLGGCAGSEVYECRTDLSRGITV